MVLTYGNLNVGWAAFSEKQLLFEATEGKKKAFILAEEHSIEQCME